MRRKSLGAFFLAVLTLAAAGQDKSKKAYELVYDDVQVLKQQVQELRVRLDRNSEEIRAVQDQIKTLADLVRQSIAGQSGVQEGLRAVPAQYQDILRKLDQLTLDLQKISADLAGRTLQTAPAVAAEEGKKPSPEAPVKTPPEAKPQPAPLKPPPAPTMSPQEAYSMAYNDYLKGNYDLAIESFKLYRQQFPESPLADNALYWIGECRYSQRKFEEAIDAFDELILAYPQGDKAAAAHLKKGLSFIELGRKPEALAALKILVAKYPLEEESRIAQDKIRELTEK
ncbi:MAG: tol-pal system protein YbgF [Candidatus Aminicenantes bacterium RBG_19FT_COMBO_65_30]|nr:MAG: tol-pal system protein YbgF [Candidatus Aminicenantes bacterium RBG_19FT_COMBO_65_30]